MNLFTKHALVLSLLLVACRETSPAPNQPDSGGAPAGNDCNPHGTYPNCGTCLQTLAEYCVGYNTCELDPSTICTRIWFGADWARGCGYVRVSYYGDVGDRATDVWDESSGKLVYHWFNGKLSSAICAPENIVGAEPPCTQWVDACGAADAGGAGG